MDNVTDALHMAFGVLIFVLALTITISSFTIVRIAATNIIDNLDKEKQYTYSYGNDDNILDGEIKIEDTNRIVGKETIIPALYRAYIENYSVSFYDKDGNEINLYKVKDENGNFNETNTLDLKDGGIGNITQAKQFVDALVNGNLESLITEGRKKGQFTRFQAEVLLNQKFCDIINGSGSHSR